MSARSSTNAERRPARAARLLALAAGCCLLATIGGAQPAPRERITLATVSAGYRNALVRLAREYERRHPGVEVRIQIQPANGFETWVRTQVEGGRGTAPDIYNANYTWGFYERGLLEDLTPFLDRENPYTGRPWRQNLDDQFLEKMKIGGDVAIIPIDFIEIAFFYNKDLFEKLGLSPPETWEEMIGQAERIRQAGHIPFAVPGDADSYWAGTVGWVFRFVTDAYTRHRVPQFLARPGDWDYDSERNAGFRLDLADPTSDAMAIVNQERLLLAVRDGEFRFDDDRFREAYRTVREFSGYWQRGFNGTSGTSAYQLFLTGRAAMMLNASPQISELARDMDDLYPEDRFRWGVFPVPPRTTGKYRLPPFRGVGGAGTMWGVVKKSPEQTRRVVDFLMFTTTPYAAQVFVEETVKARQSLVGPMLIPGAELPPQIEEHFAAFRGRGFEKLSFRGLGDEQESVWQWTVWAQRYLDGRISLDQFLDRYQALMQGAVPRVVRSMDLDLDPTTKDRPGE